VHRLGANTWIWVSPLTGARLEALAPFIAELGFDVIEMPIENAGDWEPSRAAELLGGLGLGATVCAVMPDSRDLTTDDGDVVRTTSDYLRSCVDAAAAVGSGVVAGPLYSPVGRCWRVDADERARLVARLADNLAPLADYAGEHGVRLGLEPLNRFETSMVNTVEQALEIVERVDSPALGIALDSFHMNIEERDMSAAVAAAGSRIAHVQVCGNDRGAPGSDHIDWAAFLSALAASAYDGPLCIESFTAENQTIATAASIWRPLAVTQDQLAIDGLSFLRKQLAQLQT
jgi:D-psicose/D-tagatose/L-ribulose 3-epimerase